MDTPSRRRYLEYGVVSAITFLSVGAGGVQSQQTDGQRGPNTTTQTEQDGPTPIAQSDCEPAEFEEDQSGEISFDRGPVAFESADGLVELSRVGIPFVDLEVGDDSIDLSVVTADESLELDVVDADIDIEGQGNPAELEQDDNTVEYRSTDIDLEWTPEKLDLDRPVVIDYRNEEFGYRDDRLAFEWDVQQRQFEYTCRL